MDILVVFPELLQFIDSHKKTIKGNNDISIVIQGKSLLYRKYVFLDYFLHYQKAMDIGYYYRETTYYR